MTDVSVAFQWRAVGEVKLTPKGGLVFPKLPAAPGLYRFRLVGPHRTSAYVGEAAFLPQRIEGYRYGYHRQATNVRMNRRMKEHLAAGGSIELSIATQASVTVDGVTRPLDLRRKASRLLVEAAGLHALPEAEQAENLPGVGDPEQEL
jgi:hypothetical protein